MTYAISTQLTGGNAWKRLFFWVVVLIFFLTMGLGAICVNLLFEARNSARQRATDAASRLVAVIDNDVARNIESVDLSLQAVVDGLRRPDIAQLAPDLRHIVLFDRSAIARYLGLILVTDEVGNVRLNSSTAGAQPANAADRDYFQAHKNNDNVGLYIGGPVLGRITGQPSLAISRRLSHPDGSFAGVVAGSLQLQYFKDLFANAALGPQSSVTLATTDGVVLMRWPYNEKHIGLKAKHATLYKFLAHSRTGYYEANSELDGIHRLVVYSQIGDLPLVISVGQSTAEIFSLWRGYVFVLSISGAILLAVIIILLIYLARQFTRNARYEIRLNAALGNMSQGLCMFDQNQRLVLYNDQYTEMYGLRPGVIQPGLDFRSILELRRQLGAFNGDVERYAADVTSRLEQGQTVSRTTTLANGRVIAVINRPMEGGGWVATFEDITAQRLAENELQETRMFLDSVVENIPTAIIVKDAQTRKFLLANRAFEVMRASLKSNFVGQTVFDLYDAPVAELMDKLDTECLRSEAGVDYDEHEVDIPTQGSRILNTKRIAIRDTLGAARYLVVVVEDVTEQRRLEKRISFLAHFDALTGLANRAAVTEKIEEAAARLRRYGSRFSILLLDLDRFKVVNDTLGHPGGDALLREVATRLKSLLRETDLLGRLGGDEFVVIQASENDQREAARTLSDRIIENLAKPFSIAGSDVSIGVSIGIALAPEDAINPDSLLKMADMALYNAKSGGRNGYRLFMPEMSEVANRRHELENDLRRAIEKDELVLHYQPIIDTRTFRIESAEALIRWRHPTEGMLGPDRFIPLAEETGLITQIGAWVLYAACTEAAAWPADVKIAVNVSPVQFRNSNLPDVVMYALAASGLPPERLELEITETALVESAADCLPSLHKFKNLGIGVALDDFGTGYSSLSQLTMFPFDRIKIDKSFTQNITKRADCAAIIAGTLTLASSLGIATTAEGVETAEQCRLLRLAGVTSLQGHLFKRATPAAQIDFNWVYDNLQREDAA
jgi:diguanylate cyclase (GGDEF)-like protein/PAS domain S-box-containing protein